MPVKSRLFGHSIGRIEDRALVIGGGRYLDDLQPENCLAAAFVRSTHAHALFSTVDLTAARAMPGVVAAFAASELKRRLVSNLSIDRLAQSELPSTGGQACSRGWRSGLCRRAGRGRRRGEPSTRGGRRRCGCHRFQAPSCGRRLPRGALAGSPSAHSRLAHNCIADLALPMATSMPHLLGESPRAGMLQGASRRLAFDGRTRRPCRSRSAKWQARGVEFDPDAASAQADAVRPSRSR